jgi:hypothetical protein
MTRQNAKARKATRLRERDRNVIPVPTTLLAAMPGLTGAWLAIEAAVDPEERWDLTDEAAQLVGASESPGVVPQIPDVAHSLFTAGQDDPEPDVQAACNAAIAAATTALRHQHLATLRSQGRPHSRKETPL